MTPSFALMCLRLASEEGREHAEETLPRKGSDERIIDDGFRKAVHRLAETSRKNGGQCTGEFTAREVLGTVAGRSDYYRSAVEARFAAIPGVQVRREGRGRDGNVLAFVVTWPAPVPPATDQPR